MRSMYGCPEYFRESLITRMATFPEIFNGDLFRLSLQGLSVHAKFEVRSFTCS